MSLKIISTELQRTVNNVELVSEKYATLNTDEERVLFSYDLFRDKFSNMEFKRFGKCSEKSRELRETGNHHFRKNDLWKAVNLYTESIAHAPAKSEELSLALGNRAAALLRLCLVQEALTDVNSVLAMNINEKLKGKMLERKAKCLQSVHNSRSINAGCDDVKLISKSSFLSSASPVVQLKDDGTFGRSLFVCSDVKTGEVLVVEKPFSSIVVQSHFYTHCSCCFKRSFNLMPCPSCITSMYCSENCFITSKKCHKIECKILEILTDLKATTLELLSVRVLTDASQQGENVDELLIELSKYDKNNNKQSSYDSKDHNNIYKLVGNTEKRSNSDLFQKSLIACIIVTILEKFTGFFDSCSEKKKETIIGFAGGLILRYLQSMPCNAHEISEYCDNDYEEIGAGVYATLSLINHSCDPNVVRHCYKDLIVLRAIRPIKKGEQLFDNYGYHYAVLGFHERQVSLLNQYYFECTCEACVKKWPLQQNLPEVRPIFKGEIDVQKYDLLTESFKKNVEDIFTGEFDDRIGLELMEYLNFLDEFVERPWRPYNICQEAIKHWLGLKGNCFRLLKGIEKM